MIIVSTIARVAESNASPPDDEGEHDKGGDEPCRHPEQEPLVRFHRASETKRRARSTVVSPRTG